MKTEWRQTAGVLLTVDEATGEITAYSEDRVIFNGYLFDGGNMMVGILNGKKIKSEGNAD